MKQKILLIPILAVFILSLVLLANAAVNYGDAWHPVQQIAIDDSGSADSIDEDEDGLIDASENLESSDGTSEVRNTLDMDGNNILNGNVCPDGNCDVNNYETFTSSGIGTSNIYSGSGGEVDFQDQANFNANTVRGLRNVYGDTGNDIIFRDTPQSRDGLYIRDGIAYFNEEVHTDVIQDRGPGDTIRFNSHINMNGNDIENADEIRANTFIYSSDKRLKQDITSIDNALEKLQNIDGVNFKWKESGEESIGLVAQNVETEFPELVKTDDEGMKSVEYAQMVGVLTEAVKEQQKEIDELKNEVEKLKQD
ncbi:MAG: tail fiber domain-containing protein [Nanoarchaeota archaeon]